ncbi:MAG TPA: FAD-linked oxidase C-terminal domain-containing protein [Burkholderiales bacterium]|nr:FAD-linked oxidase C-terminal domain-containing protein [Burkholderiales bacterium]
MNAPLAGARADADPIPPARTRPGDSTLAARLAREVDGEVLFDAASRGRYSTDASIYQIEPIGVVVPRSEEAARVAVAVAADAGVPILPRGAGSSQCGQTVGAALVIDHSKHLNGLLEVDAERRRALVQPGIVLDQLNARLRPHGLWYPVDVSTGAQATLGGMAGNNSCGSRSIAYGNMVHNVSAIDALLASGERWRFGPIPEVLDERAGPPAYVALLAKLRALYEGEKDEIAARFPKLLRRVAGYNLDHLGPPHANAAHLLVGSEGTLAFFERLELKLAALPAARALGVVHFPRFYAAMDCARHIVKLGPSAVELVDRTMIELARGNAAFAKTVAQFLRGEPDAILLVEFSGEDRAAQAAQLGRLVELMGDLGLPGSVVEVTDARLQRDVWEVRKAGLNIMMSMKGDGKPVSFIEDCAVPLEHLAEYTERLTQVFAKHGTRGTWYAHASVGCLHVRPVLDMRRDGAVKMRAIADEASALVRQFKGAYSGEHGDGLVRSEWIAPFLGPRLTAALAEVKSWLDPRGLMNPGKIVAPPRMDDRTLFRYKPGYAAALPGSALDWSEWEPAPEDRGAGFAKAVEMCNNNGHCRKFDAGTMCPSFRVTGDERHVTRGRANTLRLALSGQLGPDAFTSAAVKDALDLCVSCKGCKRECPTGVDMTRMKIEFLAQYRRRHGPTLRERLVAYLPHYAPLAARLAPLANLLQSLPGWARSAGITAQRPLPKWRQDRFVDRVRTLSGRREVVLLVDTFNRHFEPENARAAIRVLQAGGYRVHVAAPARERERPLCCGRTFLAAGLLEQARLEARRMIAALGPYVERGTPVLGLEPSCLYTLKDEYHALLPGPETQALGRQVLLFEEFLAREADAGWLALKLKPLAAEALLHGHCHQKAFGAMPAIERTLRLVPQLRLTAIESSCCGMAGAFGYEAEHYEVSMKMAEANLLPAVRGAPADALIVADGTSCRHQIAHGCGRGALHVARVLERALA